MHIEQHFEPHTPIPQPLQEEEPTPQKEQRLAFGKVVAIGLVIGVAAGSLVAFGGAPEHLLKALGSTDPLSKLALYAASIAGLGLLGAGLGMNHDIGRFFDRLKGLVPKNKPREKAMIIHLDIKQYSDKPTENVCNPVISTIVYDAYSDYPQSDTYQRDKMLASAKEALLRMDHTKSLPH